EYFAFLMDEEGEFELLYPFFLQNLIDDSVMEVTSDEDFIAALEDCGIIINTGEVSCDNASVSAHILLFFNQQLGNIGCGYTIDFPLQLEAEGVTYDINEYEDYLTIFNMTSQIDLVYPLNVTLIADGSTLIFNSDYEICEFIFACE
ncbi:MAG: hypothetical protein MK105_19785, partial [Crocinitomicaceae bacterium]|nr:hypothetical protein [Crocinitomicaceae bacterium]